MMASRATGELWRRALPMHQRLLSSMLMISHHHHRQLHTWGRESVGTVGSDSFRVFVVDGGRARVSAWHNVPLVADSSSAYYNYVNEIPKGTTPKMEICKRESLNPIRQDLTKENKLRFFRAGAIPFNYGALPQTWEAPDWIHPATGYPGDGDPLDAVEISSLPMQIGEIAPVEVLGILAMVDQGETDWKVVVRRVDVDPADPPLNSIIDAIRHWFRTYKIAEGKAENLLLFDGELKDPGYAADIIADAHQHWKQYIAVNPT